MLFNRERTLRFLQENGLDVIVTTCPWNVSYFTGFPLPHGCMADVQAWAVVAKSNDAHPILIAPVNAVDMALERCFIKDVRTWGHFFIYETEGMDWSAANEAEKQFKEILDREIVADDALSAVIKTLGQLGLARGKIGLDERGMIAPPSLEQFREKMPGAQVKPARNIIGMIRAVKTKEELALLRKAAQINQGGVQALLDYARPGMTELELHQVYLAAVRKAGGESHHACIQSGRRGALPNGEPSGNKLREGDSVRLDFDVIYDRYFSDMARTATVGEPSVEAVRYARSTIAALERCKEVMRPGVKASEVFREGIQAARKSGIPDFDRHHIGHGIGLACYDLPLLSPKVDIPLEEGMVINIETPYYKLGFGASHFEDTMLINAGGVEDLITMSLELKKISLK